MPDKQNIVWVSNKVSSSECLGLVRKIQDTFPVELTQLSDYPTLFSRFGDPEFKTDFVVVDVDQILDDDRISLFDILESLRTMIAVSFQIDYSTPTARLAPRQCRIIAMVSLDTPAMVLRQMKKMDHISGWTLRTGPNITDRDILDCMELYLGGQKVIPPKILDIIAARIAKKKSKDIVLTPRQSQILDMVATRGASNKVIAKTLKISESTVKLHMSAILKKYGCRNRTQLAVFSRDRVKTLASWLMAFGLLFGIGTTAQGPDLEYSYLMMPWAL